MVADTRPIFEDLIYSMDSLHSDSSVQVGKGSFSTVYVQVTPSSIVAIKKIPLHLPHSSRFFLNEITFLSACRHPHIVRHHHSYTDSLNGVYCIQLQHLPGGTLSHMTLPSTSPLLPRWTGQICSALAYIHQRGIIHRDLKLSNLMLSADGDVKLIDFGVSIWQWMLPYESNNVVGSPCYMAPEVFLKKYDSKIDIYALGVCVYQLIHGRLPYQGKEKQQYWTNALSDEVSFGEECPQFWVNIIKAMLQRDSKKRLSAKEVHSRISYHIGILRKTFKNGKNKTETANLK